MRRPAGFMERLDRLYPTYVGALILGYVLIAVAYRPTPPVTAAVLDARSVVGVMLALGVVVALASGLAYAVDGGPVVLDPSDAVVVLSWPVPRPSIVRPALRRAYRRGGLAGFVVGLVLTAGVVRNLAMPLADVWMSTFAAPVLVGVLVVGLGWLGQGRGWSRYARPAELATGTVFVVLLVAAVHRGIRPRDLVNLARAPSLLRPLAAGLDVTGEEHLQPLTLAALLLALVITVVIGEQRTRSVSAQQLAARSRRGGTLAAAWFVLDTATVYLHRTHPGRVRRRDRRVLPSRGVRGALVSKSFLQSQGGPLALRIPVAAALICGLTTVARELPHAPASSVVAWSVAAGLSLAWVGRTWADPARLDYAYRSASSRLPVTYDELIVADVIGSALMWAPAAVLAAVIVATSAGATTGLAVLWFGAAVGVSVVGMSVGYAFAEQPVFGSDVAMVVETVRRFGPWVVVAVLAAMPVALHGMTPFALTACIAILVGAGAKAATHWGAVARVRL